MLEKQDAVQQWVNSHDENGLIERDRKPPRANGRTYRPTYSPTATDVASTTSQQFPTNNRHYRAPYSPTSTDGSIVAPSVNGDVSEVEMRYNSMVTNLKDELSFLEDSNANLLVELRESQDSNYVLTEELRRLQRNNLNILDELQACQTANSVLRQELQRLEQASVKQSRDVEKYKKANTMLKDEIKELKNNQKKRKYSMVTLKEKAKDLQKDIMEKEKDFQELSSLKQTVSIIVDAVELDGVNDNGYCPTDSDTVSTDGNDDQQLDAFTPKPVRKSDQYHPSPIPSPLARKFFSGQTKSPDLRRKHDGLFGRRQNSRTSDLIADFTERSRSRSLNIANSGGREDDSPSPPDAQSDAGGSQRRGSLDSFVKDVKPPTNSLRNDTLTRLLGKSLDKLNEHKVKRSNSNVHSNRPKSMTYDFNDNWETQDRLSGDAHPPINSSPEKGTFEL